MSNLVPGQYREVSVTQVDFPLVADVLRAHFQGREVYRRTRFVVVRGGADTALIGVAKTSSGALMETVTGVDIVALPGECLFLTLPAVDTAVPSALAQAARRHGGGARCVVVQGRYQHISFIVDPAPLRIRVTEVVPPEPAKLVDQAARVLELAEDLPPIELVPDLVDLGTLMAGHPAPRYLLPCRGSGFAGGQVDFLDERPPRQDWALIGCARSRALHQWFYGDVPPGVELCPRLRPQPAGAVTLTKCCLLEDHNEIEADRVVVPWGASLALVHDALATLARSKAPAWSPG
ncbi:MAG: hypothetical protein M3N98_06925 [Actinomycetota bacterium]|nr:hypothetical protein [Actinomycetota bacterium]